MWELYDALISKIPDDIEVTGQGAHLLKSCIDRAPDTLTLTGRRLRFTTPSSICSYCTGDTQIGEQHRLGMQKAMEFDD